VAKFSYVYVLVSEFDPTRPGGAPRSRVRHYVGLTDDLKDRLRRHNAGEVRHTAKYRPRQLQVAVAFSDRKKAAEFEIYLKSHSGRAFAKRHF
jgi:predicted GIY-YIG superfamily endonuclease